VHHVRPHLGEHLAEESLDARVRQVAPRVARPALQRPDLHRRVDQLVQVHPGLAAPPQRRAHQRVVAALAEVRDVVAGRHLRPHEVLHVREQPAVVERAVAVPDVQDAHGAHRRTRR
jgi:hypothetical protein